MKILVASPYATVAPHFETELEILQGHLDQGDQVELLACVGGLANCDFNSEKSKSICNNCVGRRRHGLSLLSRPTKLIALTASNEARHRDSIQRIANCESIAQLTGERYENFDIGYAVLSSLVSLVRDPAPNLSTHRELVIRLATSALETYTACCNYMAEHKPDRIYLFNGRFAAMRAVLRAAQNANVECLIHERGCDLSHFELYQNHLPHDIPSIDKAIRSAWSSAIPECNRIEVASEWFRNRVNRVESNWHSFVRGQQAGQLPPAWDSAKRNIATFCSSDDEFAAIGDCWKNNRFPNQSETIGALCRHFVDRPELHFTLRMHPNLANARNATKKRMLEMDFPNLTVISPDDGCDSYALLKAADQVVTFGSSVGIEAVFWRRPSILLGPCFYQELGGTYSPQTFAELTELVSSSLGTLDSTGAYMYGFWMQTHGIPFKYFEPDGLFHGRFKGEVVYDKPPRKTLLTRIGRLLTGTGRVREKARQLTPQKVRNE